MISKKNNGKQLQYIYQLLRWMETFHMTDTHKHRYVSEGLQFNVLIREDLKD